ncbi:MAG: hypothetical protein AAFR67_10945, partial [Chloroflexota bacterium]
FVTNVNLPCFHPTIFGQEWMLICRVNDFTTDSQVKRCLMLLFVCRCDSENFAFNITTINIRAYSEIAVL